MRTNKLDLFVECRLGDLAFLKIHYEPAVGTEEADVQTLFELVPLAANHNAVPITVGLRARNYFSNITGGDAANPLEQIAYLLVLEPELHGVIQVLILAAAALAEVRAKRLDPLGGGSHDTKKPRSGEALLYLRHFHFHDLARSNEGYEHDKFFRPADALATERNIVDRQSQLIAWCEAHVNESRRFNGAKR